MHLAYNNFSMSSCSWVVDKTCEICIIDGTNWSSDINLNDIFLVFQTICRWILESLKQQNKRKQSKTQNKTKHKTKQITKQNKTDNKTKTVDIEIWHKTC